MSCECPECSEYAGPNPRIMMLKFLVLGAQLLLGLTGLLKERSWKALGAFFAGLALFWSIPRYLICARCEGYGRKCHSFYLGKATSLYMPKVEGKKVGPLAMVLEIIALSLISQSPAVGIKNSRKRVLYVLLSTATVVMHFMHSCRHCATYATDWKRNCPAARGYRLFFGAGREVAL